MGAEIQPVLFSKLRPRHGAVCTSPKSPTGQLHWSCSDSKLRLLVGHGWLCQVVLLRAELWSWSPLCALGPGGCSPVSLSKTVTLSSRLPGPSDSEEGGGRGGNSQQFSLWAKVVESSEFFSPKGSALGPTC